MYLDETWVNAHDSKNKAWGEKDTITGGRIGGVKFVVLCFFIRHSNYITEHHLAKEITLFYYMLVEKMDGFPVRECSII